MRKVFFTDAEAATYEAAQELAPWAAVVEPADGGWWAFESILDAIQWQKDEDAKNSNRSETL